MNRFFRPRKNGKININNNGPKLVKPFRKLPSPLEKYNLGLKYLKKFSNNLIRMKALL